jgi:hypothetical protein
MRIDVKRTTLSQRSSVSRSMRIRGSDASESNHTDSGVAANRIANPDHHGIPSV